MRRYSLSLFAIIIAALAAPTAFAETVAGSVREGNTLYREGKYEEALKKYETAQVESPDDERIMFNLGGAQYRLENYERALSEFMKAVPAADRKMSAPSHYNAGNALYRAGRLEDAVEQYLATIEIDPDDEDAKHNLEFVRREIDRRMQQQQERQRQQQEQQEPDDSSETGEPQPKDQESENQDGRPPENDPQQEHNAPEQETDSRPEASPEQNQNERPEPPKKGSEPGQSVSDDNLQRWLDAVEAESAENMKEFLRKQQPTQVVTYPEDW